MMFNTKIPGGVGPPHEANGQIPADHFGKQDIDGMTALHVVARGGNATMAAFLLDNGESSKLYEDLGLAAERRGPPKGLL